MCIHRNTENLRPTVAILDWGIGGMEFYRIFKENYPEAGVCYFSDTGSVPYGKQRKEQLLQRLSQVVEFLAAQGVTHLVVACNAMSTVLQDWSVPEEIKDFHVTGVIGPAVAAALSCKGERAGVVGGRRTILSGAYARPLRKSFGSVIQRIAQPLSAFIEKGEKDTPQFQETLEKIMGPLKKSDILLLACTHYPAAQDAFQKLAPHAKMINPALETFQRVVKNWSFTGDSAADIFYTTGDRLEMRTAAFKAFGVTLGEITHLPTELNLKQEGACI